MCNQCSDYRRIHVGKTVFGVFHNGKMNMAFSREVAAIRAKQALSGENGAKYCQCTAEEDCEWEVFQVERKSISWEG